MRGVRQIPLRSTAQDEEMAEPPVHHGAGTSLQQDAGGPVFESGGCLLLSESGGQFSCKYADFLKKSA